MSHDHHHDHDHGHDHGHDHAPDPAQPSRRPGGTASTATLDSGSQALTEALRGSFVIVKFVMLALLAVFVLSGFFSVGPQEKAIILRFGKPVGEGDKMLRSAGLHWAWPYPIDEVERVPITEIQKVTTTVGWYATTPEMELAGTEPPPGPSLNPAIDGYALTADGNIVHTRATLRYRIADPIRYVFGFSSGSNAVQNSLNNALLYAAARFGVDEILTRDVAGFKDAVARRFDQLAAAQQLGVVVDQCDVESRAPRQLKAVFDQVITAGQNRSKVLNEARSFENEIRSKAESGATNIINLAETERKARLDSLGADVQRFQALRPNFERNPELYRQQELVKVMGRVLTNVNDRIYLPDRPDGKSRELRLQLNREPVRPKTEEKP
jgi:membrane protease subunit HflK